MTKVNIHQAKTQFSRLVELAAGGEEIIIAKSGKPVARLVSYTQKAWCVGPAACAARFG
jgi:prevent-host-death family protein